MTFPLTDEEVAEVLEKLLIPQELADLRKLTNKELFEWTDEYCIDYSKVDSLEAIGTNEKPLAYFILAASKGYKPALNFLPNMSSALLDGELSPYKDDDYFRDLEANLGSLDMKDLRNYYKFLRDSLKTPPQTPASSDDEDANEKLIMDTLEEFGLSGSATDTITATTTAVLAKNLH